MRHIFLLVFSLFTICIVHGQCGPLSTPTFTNNGQSGIMFDVVALTPVTITQLAMDYDPGNYNIEVYSIAGTHVGNEMNAAAWTLQGVFNGLNFPAAGINTLIPIVFNQFICAGDRAGFYITANNSTSGNYSNGTGVGNVIVADGNIQILEGTGKAHPFGTSFTPRVPNVTVFYDCSVSCCTPPTMSMVASSCAGACDGTAMATVGAGGIGPYTYLWDAAAGNQITQTAVGLCAGTYTVEVTDNTGCVSSGTVTVSSGTAVADATITGAGPFCETAVPFNLTAAEPGGTWSGTGITDPVAGTFDPTVAGPGNWTITYTISGACGASDTEDITVLANANATITAAGPFCTGDLAFTLTAAEVGGTWSGTGITNATTGIFDPASAGPGNHTITYSIAGACPDAQTTSITVNLTLDATINTVGPFCESDPVITLTGADPGGSWSGTGVTDPVAGTFDPALAGSGNWVVTYDITGACGATDTETIVINADADATINPAGPFCPGDPIVTLVGFDPGGTWSGTGITDPITGAFDPGIAGSGSHAITYNVGGACPDVQTVNLLINASFDATISPVGPFCESDMPVSINAVDPGGNWSGTGITDPVSGTFDPSVSGAGTFTITYVIPGSCGSSDTENIIVNADANASISPVGPFCDTDPIINLSGADPGGTWSGLGITNTLLGSFDPTTAGAGTHVITYSLGGLCPDLQTTDIVVNEMLDATISPSGPYCESDGSVNLSAVDAGGLWSGIGITDVTIGTFDPSMAGSGNHLITYTISGACGATDTENILVNVDADATIVPVGPYCSNAMTTILLGNDPGGVWAGIGIADPATGLFDPALAGAGTHTITYSIGGVCPDVQTYDVIVNLFLDATITAATPFCESNIAVNLTAADAGGIWSGNGITDANAGTFDPSVAAPGLWTVTYTIPGSCGSSDTEDVLVIADSDASIYSAGPFCDNATAITMTAMDVGGVWSGTGITDGTLGTFDPIVAGAGTHAITYTISGACGDSDTEDIIVLAQQDATITPVGPFCELDPSISLTGVDPGGIWSGSGVTDPTLGTFDPLIAGPGVHTVSYNISGTCGDLKTYDITVNQNMDATISPAGPYCLGEPSVNLNSVDPGGSWSGTGITDPILGSFDPGTAGVGNWTITYSISGMCGDLQTTEINIVPNTLSTIDVVGPFCIDDASVNMTAANPGGTWSGPGITDSVIGTFDPLVAGAGASPVVCMIPGGCGSSDTIDVIVNPLPVVTFAVDQSSGCEPLLVNFSNSSSGSVSCFWDFGSEGTSTDCLGPSISYSVGSYDVSLTITDANGCVNTLDSLNMINSYAYPNADFSFGPQPTTILNADIEFTNMSSGGANYVWDFSGLGQSMSFEDSFTFPDTGVYIVELLVTSPEGCSDSISYPLVIGPELIVFTPNAFTPDGDTRNDVFMPSVLGYVPSSYQFLVFNRWGEVIFQSQYANVGWDGTVNGVQAPNDVYVWKLSLRSEATNLDYSYKGHVTLVR